MKRSEINSIIKEMEVLIKENGFKLPPFADWTPEEWKTKGCEYDEIRDNMLGWDITDFGLGDFDKVGFGLITLRNGNRNNAKYKKVYAEKLLFLGLVTSSFKSSTRYPSTPYIIFGGFFTWLASVNPCIFPWSVMAIASIPQFLA